MNNTTLGSSSRTAFATIYLMNGSDYRCHGVHGLNITSDRYVVHICAGENKKAALRRPSY
jgi:hypothetical protein